MNQQQIGNEFKLAGRNWNGKWTRGRNAKRVQWEPWPETVKTELASTTNENKKDNIKVCVCSLSLSLSSRFIISLRLAQAVDSFFIRSFSLLDDYLEV